MRRNALLFTALLSVLLTVTLSFDAYARQRNLDQRKALIALYKATGGKEWLHRESWCSSKPLSEWEGITCDSEGNVVSLQLKDNNLCGELPDIFHAFTALRKIDFSANNISGEIPRSLAGLHEKARVDLRKNRLATTTLYVPRSRISHVSRTLICYPQQEGYHAFRLFVDCDVDLNPTNGLRADNELRIYQKATEGAGINIYIVGDGYDRAEHAVGGTADYWLERTAEAIFEIEPMSKLRSLFNVYIVYSHSPEQGVSLFDNERLSSFGYWQKRPTERSNALFNANEVFRVCKEGLKRAGLTDNTTDVIHVHMAVNSTHTGLYRGMAYSRRVQDPDTDKQRIARVTLLPTNPASYNSLVWHEFVGHTFGKLKDEYVPKNGVVNIYKGTDTSANLDIESDPKRVKWARFIEDERYAHEKLGVYKGGGNRYSNLYRATDRSIMRQGGNSKLRFNAPSRAQIYTRAMSLAYPNWQFDYEEFVRFDLKH